jgi:hypothetical protein
VVLVFDRGRGERLGCANGHPCVEVGDELGRGLVADAFGAGVVDAVEQGGDLFAEGLERCDRGEEAVGDRLGVDLRDVFLAQFGSTPAM